MMTLQDFFNRVADWAGKPSIIIAVTVVTIAAYVLGFVADIINLSISIASLVLSLMILGKQNQVECRDQLRDEALHAKVDELIHATSEARDELEGLEEKPEEEVHRVKRSGQ